jgi:hypothetical protein
VGLPERLAEQAMRKMERAGTYAGWGRGQDKDGLSRGYKDTEGTLAVRTLRLNLSV